MTPEEQRVTQEFGNAVAQVLAACGVIKFCMDLQRQTVSIDIEETCINIGLLEDTKFELEELLSTIEE
ncbi:hypothetical protein [Formosa sp. A9]|uniref:hypothetical protein n=1 Tax=Formosa sp. A9 TaxID=3442641 RepID=UPI003EC00EB9